MLSNYFLSYMKHISSLPKNKNRLIPWLLGIIQICLVSYILLFPIGRAWREITGILGTTSLFLYYILDYKNSNLKKLDFRWLLFLFLSYWVIKAFITVNLIWSLQALREISYRGIVFLFIALESIRNKNDLKNFAIVINILALYLGLDALYQYFVGVDLLRGRPIQGYLTASFRGPHLGTFMAMFLPMTFTLFTFLPEAFSKCKKLIFYVLITSPSYFFLYASGRRSGWIGFIIAITVFVFLKARKKYIALLVPLSVILIFICVSIYNPTFRCSYQSIMKADRWKIWNVALKITKHNLILGHGILSYGPAGKKYNLAIPCPECRLGVENSAHNIYLEFLVDTGILGLSLFLSLITIIIWKTYKTAQKLAPSEPQIHLILYCLISSLAAYLAGGLSGFGLYKGWWIAPPMIFWGTMMGAYTIHDYLDSSQQHKIEA